MAINHKKFHADIERVKRVADAHIARLPEHRHFPKWALAIIIFFFSGIFLFLGITVAWAMVASIPSINNFENRRVSESTKIFDRTGLTVLYDVHGAVRRTIVPLSEMSPYIPQAAIAIEDDQFYSHKGFRPRAFMRAVWVNITAAGYAQGGSTITQQVVKNTLLSGDKTPVRKLKEIILALRLERLYSKDQILEAYLNENGYGGTIYGVEEASNYFFGKDAKDVTLAEAAYLAAIPQAPTRLSPHGNNRDMLEARKNLVLIKMKEHGMITDEEYQDAMEEEVNFKKVLSAAIKAPHFVFYVREYLEQKYGADVVQNDGLKVYTTLDYELQSKSEQIVREYGARNIENFNATNASLVVIEPTTGQILTMVGARDYFDESIDGNVNIALALRQPGSAIKPFVYASAFEKGYTPETIVYDAQTQFSTWCEPTDVASSTPPCYSPGNYDEVYSGPITLKSALALSKNIPAVKALYLAGIKESLNLIQRMGITSLNDPTRYGLTLVLGGGEVTLLDLTSGYGVFANEGKKNPTTGILRVEDKNGNILEQYEQKEVEVLDTEISRQITDILSDNKARTPGFGANSPLHFPGVDLAAKTGTTNDYRDVWIVGYTPNLAIGAWAGNSDNTPMVRKVAAFIIAPMWHEVFEEAIKKYPSGSFTKTGPDASLTEAHPFLRGDWQSTLSGGVHDILYWVQKDNPRSGVPGNQNDTQTARWDYGALLWATGSSSSLTQYLSSTTPSTTQQQATRNPITFLSPAPGSILSWGVAATMSISIDPTLQVESVAYYMNGSAVGTSQQPPYIVQANPSTRGTVIIRAIAQTKQGTFEATQTIAVQ